jgi:Fic family protein
MLILEEEDPELFAEVQDKNLVRQYGLLETFIEIGLRQGRHAFDKYAIWSLNHVAVAGIAQFAGQYREHPIYVGEHTPPHFRDVPRLMDHFIAFVHENWFNLTSTQLAAYGLWRLSWIHPFSEGNGRTGRAVCYYLLCVKEKRLLPGKKIVPERIRENRAPCVDALRAADKAWEQSNLDVSQMEAYLARLLTEQLRDAKEASEANNPPSQG